VTTPHKRRHPPLRLQLSVPVTSLLPGLQLDPLKALTGRSLAEVLSPVLEAEPWTTSGRTTYPLSLPDGVGVAVPLGGFGEMGFNHAAGNLQVTAPALVAALLHQLPYRVGGAELLSTPQGRLSRYTIAPPRGVPWRLAIAGGLALTLTRV
jgi:hypothetical protein